jgi:hypothetical protein
LKSSFDSLGGGSFFGGVGLLTNRLAGNPRAERANLTTTIHYKKTTCRETKLSD